MIENHYDCHLQPRPQALLVAASHVITQSWAVKKSVGREG